MISSAKIENIMYYQSYEEADQAYLHTRNVCEKRLGHDKVATREAHAPKWQLATKHSHV